MRLTTIVLAFMFVAPAATAFGVLAANPNNGLSAEYADQWNTIMHDFCAQQACNEPLLTEIVNQCNGHNNCAGVPDMLEPRGSGRGLPILSCAQAEATLQQNPGWAVLPPDGAVQVYLVVTEAGEAQNAIDMGNEDFCEDRLFNWYDGAGGLEISSDGSSFGSEEGAGEGDRTGTEGVGETIALASAGASAGPSSTPLFATLLWTMAAVLLVGAAWSRRRYL